MPVRDDPASHALSFGLVFVDRAGDFGDTVRAARRVLGLTQVEAAKRAGVGKRFLVELENGKTSVRLDKVCAVMGALGVAVMLAPAEDLARVLRS